MESEGDIGKGIEVLREKSNRVEAEFRNSIKRLSDELAGKQRELEAEEGRVGEIRRLKKAVEREIEGDNKKLERLKKDIEEQGRALAEKQEAVSQLVERQKRIEEKQGRDIENDESRKEKLEAEKEKLKQEISKRQVELRELEGNFNSEIHSKEEKIKKLTSLLA